MQRSTLMLIITALLAFIVLAIGCNQPIKYPPGGYEYPSRDSVTDTDFYFYPIRAHFRYKELFGVSDYYLFYQAFDEPNLSIKPMPENTFRFLHYGFRVLPLFITFNEHEMIIKKGTKYFMAEGLVDTNRLTQIERSQYRILKIHFPLNENGYDKKSKTGRLIDSMVRLYPQLLDINYYKYLLTKIIIPNAKHPDYTIQKIALLTNDFKHLVNIINSCGYWQMPSEIVCGAEVLDGNGFSLEANTGKKYNCVQFGSCAENTVMQKAFVAACKAIVERANLGEKIYF